jgi:hypothetical protein
MTMCFRLRTLLIAVMGTAFLLFGLGCLNYTKAGGLQHHLEVAHRYGLPPPSELILLSGAAAIAIGAGMIGFSFGTASSR